jgi:cyclopropane fatty-acyl-phospholipid synthase-like methyltransferase
MMGSEAAMDSEPSPIPEPSSVDPNRRYVGVLHEFHNAVYARDWADRFTPSPPREALFAAMLLALRQQQLPESHVLELGIGPAYFAERLLRQRPDLQYEGLDFSQPMLDLAAERIRPFRQRVRLTLGDLLQAEWPTRVQHPVGAIVSTWSLHDLGAEERTAQVYTDCYRLLEYGGILLNGDFVKPEGTAHDYEPGRFPVWRHLELLAAAGFSGCRCLGSWENELIAPTTAHNYACLLAVK